MRKLIKIRSIRQSACDPEGCGVPPLEDMKKKGMKQGSHSRVTVGEGLIPHSEPSFLWLTNIKITHDYANGVRIRRPMWVDETQPLA